MIDLYQIKGINAVVCQANRNYNKEKAEFFSNAGPGFGRLGHSRSIENPDNSCSNWNSETDTVKCFYVFGETLIIQTHPFGKCPWKML